MTGHIVEGSDQSRTQHAHCRRLGDGARQPGIYNATRMVLSRHRPSTSCHRFTRPSPSSCSLRLCSSPSSLSPSRRSRLRLQRRYARVQLVSNMMMTGPIERPRTGSCPRAALHRPELQRLLHGSETTYRGLRCVPQRIRERREQRRVYRQLGMHILLVRLPDTSREADLRLTMITATMHAQTAHSQHPKAPHFRPCRPARITS